MARLILDLAGGEGIRIVGPATLKVESGLALLLGAELGPGARIEVPRDRSYYVMAVEPSTILLSLGEDGRLEHASPGEEPLKEWVGHVDEALDSCGIPCKAVVIGPVDAGKTSVSALISNRALLRGLKPQIIDGDIGQADIGPPGFVSSSIPQWYVLWLRSLEPDKMVFVGHVEPQYVEARILYGLMRLLLWGERRGAHVTVIDTDGWVEGWHAMEYKLNILRAVNVDLVVTVGDKQLYKFLSRRWPATHIYLPKPARLLARDTADRRRLRKENYRRFLHQGVERDIDLNETPIVNACIEPSTLGTGSILVLKYPGGVCAYFDSESPPDPQQGRAIAQKEGVKEALIIYKGGMRGVLVGLADQEGWDHPGIVTDVNLSLGRLRVKTPYRGEIRYIVAGRLRLTEEYEDLGQRRIWI
ncbi:MAG: hypothetical protein F7C35_05785 [Desulfurococcales archaeon]|nr:hypothetical protein [Desulfurococcales archaeon]